MPITTAAAARPCPTLTRPPPESHQYSVPRWPGNHEVTGFWSAFPALGPDSWPSRLQVTTPAQALGPFLVWGIRWQGFAGTPAGHLLLLSGCFSESLRSIPPQKVRGWNQAFHQRGLQLLQRAQQSPARREATAHAYLEAAGELGTHGLISRQLLFRPVTARIGTRFAYVCVQVIVLQWDSQAAHGSQGSRQRSVVLPQGLGKQLLASQTQHNSIGRAPTCKILFKQKRKGQRRGSTGNFSTFKHWHTVLLHVPAAPTSHRAACCGLGK